MTPEPVRSTHWPGVVWWGWGSDRQRTGGVVGLGQAVTDSGQVMWWGAVTLWAGAGRQRTGNVVSAVTLYGGTVLGWDGAVPGWRSLCGVVWDCGAAGPWSVRICADLCGSVRVCFRSFDSWDKETMNSRTGCSRAVHGLYTAVHPMYSWRSAWLPVPWVRPKSRQLQDITERLPGYGTYRQARRSCDKNKIDNIFAKHGWTSDLRRCRDSQQRHKCQKNRQNEDVRRTTLSE